jgi:hypothetical protein
MRTRPASYHGANVPYDILVLNYVCVVITLLKNTFPQITLNEMESCNITMASAEWIFSINFMQHGYYTCTAF